MQIFLVAQVQEASSSSNQKIPTFSSILYNIKFSKDLSRDSDQQSVLINSKLCTYKRPLHWLGPANKEEMHRTFFVARDTAPLWSSSHYRDPPPQPRPPHHKVTPNMFKLVHYMAPNVSKWTVCIQLKCLLVLHWNHCQQSGYNEYPQMNMFEHVQVVVTWGPPSPSPFGQTDRMTDIHDWVH